MNQTNNEKRIDVTSAAQLPEGYTIHRIQKATDWTSHEDHAQDACQTHHGDSTSHEAGTHYAGLRDLWCKVFGDEPGYVDHTYDSFGDDIEGYIITDESGQTVSALTCYLCGTYCSTESTPTDPGSKPVYVSYAICTDPASRGLGLAGKLTSIVRDIVTAPAETTFVFADGTETTGKNGLSIVSPAEPSLVDFYKGLSYTEHFYASVHATSVDDFGEDPDSDFGAGFLEPELDSDVDVTYWGGDSDESTGDFYSKPKLEPISASDYNAYRERFLADVPHVALSDAMAEFVQTESHGGSGLYLINGGDAICMLQGIYKEGDYESAAFAAELLVNPRLKEFSCEIDDEIAAGIAEHFGVGTITYRAPDEGCYQSGCPDDGAGPSADGYCQSMISARADWTGSGSASNSSANIGFESAGLPYFGFPID